MRFPSRFLSRFASFTRRSSVRFDEVPDREENLARFIFSNTQFSLDPRRVKPGAFLPTRDPLETSVFRTVGLDAGEVQRRGGMVGGLSDRNLKAWGDVLAGVVFHVGLGIRPDNDPERHAAIIGWPAQKDEQLSMAQQLAAAAIVRLPS